VGWEGGRAAESGSHGWLVGGQAGSVTSTVRTLVGFELHSPAHAPEQSRASVAISSVEWRMLKLRNSSAVRVGEQQQQQQQVSAVISGDKRWVSVQGAERVFTAPAPRCIILQLCVDSPGAKHATQVGQGSCQAGETLERRVGQGGAAAWALGGLGAAKPGHPGSAGCALADY